MIKPIQSVAFYDYRKIDPQAWSEQRVATQFANKSRCGNRNEWCEVRAEHSPIALLHHVFETAEQAAKYCKQFGTVTELEAGGMQLFNYLMGRRPKKIPLFRRDNSNQTSIHAQDNTEYSNMTLQQQVQQLNDANTAYLSSKSQHERDLQRLNDAQDKLDHCQAQFASLHEAYNQQVDDEREMLAQIDTLFAERANMRTEYEYSLMRLRVRCFALVCAIVLLIVSGLVVWGGV